MDTVVKNKFETYPEEVKSQLLKIREAIYEVAENENIGVLTETLKWGEPSFLSEKGSTIRIDWKPKSPDHFSVYFNCKTTLIETFKEIYKDTFQFQGNREIKFLVSEPVPMSELKACISMSLRYHRIKHLPLLGA